MDRGQVEQEEPPTSGQVDVAQLWEQASRTRRRVHVVLHRLKKVEGRSTCGLLMVLLLAVLGAPVVGVLWGRVGALSESATSTADQVCPSLAARFIDPLCTPGAMVHVHVVAADGHEDWVAYVCPRVL